MGKPGQPKKVLLFIATLFKEQDAYYKAIEILEDKFGQILVESSPKLWNYSDYYTPELGSPIKRRFIFFKNLISEADIAKIKIQTNQIEEELSKHGKRTINLDPGYIGLAKLVLATTKDYSHRIYLSNGIYAEVTLIFKNNSFMPNINTYRDYAEEEYIKLFNLARTIYKDLLLGKN
ncbi:hypothetical protein TAGGR_1293 [Thermodesulfovibrio aggregans]|uniref:DUF4416 family protein n=1 Tax=Thermodesulfovibrio aggregans TaxID=86166 RepID=A0A0U9HM10_9BACT|nr:DUF4416 family protein [Thermodesulfovibrio aggregans]GAQ94120.1 hypothetical protein TAGGR_1293 [Thermodesulfovibrio aggregans]